MSLPWQKRLEYWLLRWQARLDHPRVDRLAPWLIAAASWAVLVLLALARSRELGLGTSMASPMQVTWLIGDGYKPESSLLGHNVLWEQAAFLLYPVSWLTSILPTATTLLVLQAAALSIAVVPLWRLAKGVAGLRTGATTAIVAAYAAHSAVHDANLAGFHVEVLAIPALFGAVLYGLRGRWVLFGACVVVVLAARSDLGLAVAGLGGLLALEGRRRAGLITALVGVGWAVCAAVVIQPRYGGGAYPHVEAFARFGDDPASVLWGMITHPHELLGDVVSEANFSKIVSLLAPVLFLPVVAPRYLLPAVPLYALYLAADVPAGDLLEAQQTVPIIVFIFVATVFALARTGRVLVEKVNVDRRFILALVFTATLFFVRDSLSSPYEEPWGWGRRELDDRARLEAVDLVPDDGVVRASPAMLPLLTQRFGLFQLDTTADPDPVGAAEGVNWILLDAAAAPTWDSLDFEQFDLRLARAGWVSEYDAEGIRVYRLPSPDEVQDQAGASAGG
ncbi:MAG: DUF2079 domain-containing protein [Acidimicrobiales bacterium]|nr:DUF2079 domain-containing protein [Acidimicrobiales bacterium]